MPYSIIFPLKPKFRKDMLNSWMKPALKSKHSYMLPKSSTIEIKIFTLKKRYKIQKNQKRMILRESLLEKREDGQAYAPSGSTYSHLLLEALGIKSHMRIPRGNFRRKDIVGQYLLQQG